MPDEPQDDDEPTTKAAGTANSGPTGGAVPDDPASARERFRLAEGSGSSASEANAPVKTFNLGSPDWTSAAGRSIVSNSFATNLAGGLKGMIDTLDYLQPMFDRARANMLIGIETVGRAIAAAFPPNWTGAGAPEWDVVERLVLDEGLPLAWVPNTETLRAIFDAESPEARRQVYGTQWVSIATDCLAALEKIGDDSAWVSDRDFARESAKGLLDGHRTLSQALSVNLSDSILHRGLARVIINRYTKSKARPDLTEETIKGTLVLGPVWSMYTSYRPGVHAAIPAGLNRHATAHSVSPTQYSDINAVMALCHVTSLICFLDSERD